MEKKRLCAFDLFVNKNIGVETPKCLLCPENCNDPKILEAVYDKTPTENKDMEKDRKTIIK